MMNIMINSIKISSRMASAMAIMIPFCTYVRPLFQRRGIYDTLTEIEPISFERKDMLVDG